MSCLFQLCSLCKEPTVDTDTYSELVSQYRCPDYIVHTAKRKYGQSIHVIGSKRADINKFIGQIVQQTRRATVPEEVGRTVVDIDSKCHLNKSEQEAVCDQESEKPEDWYDEFEITSKKGTSESRSKSYQLQLTNSKQTQYGANLNFKVGGSGFFNMAAGVAPEIGGGGGFSKTKTKTEQTTESSTNQESLSQGYQVVDRLKVPPRTKVAAKITTWAVTYESKTRIKLAIDAEAFIPVRYRTRFAQLLGGICASNGRVTAEDLFVNEEEYKSENGIVTFERDGSISYLGEEVEITKTKTDC